MNVQTTAWPAFTLESMQGTRLPWFVNGDFREKDGPGLDSFDPATGEPWCSIAECGAAEVDEAVRAARAALKSSAWHDITQSERGRLMMRLSELVERDVERLAQIETRDNGKLLKEMRALTRAVAVGLRYYAGMADKVQGETIPVNKPDMLNFTIREPIGVVAAIIPWNSPLLMLNRALAPCLAVGNTMVVKPSEHASAAVIAFAGLLAEAGFPAGVFNVVTGTGQSVGDALVRHPEVDKVDFTGGPATGRVIARSAAENLTPSILELGGKSPHVVCEDADLDRAVTGVVSGIFAAAGQTCVAGARCFVQESIYDDVVERVAAAAAAIRIGAPAAEDTDLGPLGLYAQVGKVAGFVDSAKAQGARLVFGGGRPEGFGNGWYVEPTVFADVTNDMRLAREEVFGPVLGLLRYSDEADLIAQANDCAFGLAAGMWTRDIDRALRFARRIDAGMVWINTYRSPSIMSPSGGFKDSGYGKHNGFAAIAEYSRLKTVVIDYSGKTQDPFVMRVNS